MAEANTTKRVTADEYQRLGRAGVLSPGERVELIDGKVLAMTPIGARHNACVSSATRALVLAAGDSAIVLPQGSVRLDRYHEPHPDLALLRPRKDFYASRHAGPADVLLVIEIADASIEYDRVTKASLYASARIPEYWLADLNANIVLRFSSAVGGVYQDLVRYRRGQTIAPLALPGCTIDVDALLIE